MRSNTYDQFADQYADLVAARDETAFEGDPVLKALFDLIGEVEGLNILDAGTGEGFVARILNGRGAKVVAIDISESLLEKGRLRDTEGQIDFRCHDLSQPLVEFEGYFDLAVGNLVLNDVPDYRGFISTVDSVLKPGGRLILSLNNPYSAVFREKATSYFDSRSSVLYGGMAEAGVKVYYYHRTMADYIAAFRENGLLLKSLIDIPPDSNSPEDRHYKWNVVPFLMVIELVKLNL